MFCQSQCLCLSGSHSRRTTFCTRRCLFAGEDGCFNQTLAPINPCGEPSLSIHPPNQASFNPQQTCKYKSKKGQRNYFQDQYMTTHNHQICRSGRVLVRGRRGPQPQHVLLKKLTNPLELNWIFPSFYDLCPART